MSESACDPIERLSLQAEALVADRYRLVERIGAGGMGSVWRARHVTLSHEVAIKFLQVSEVSPAARARFEREAKLAARLGEASRHITRVIDYGVFSQTIPYLVMEMLQGETLSARARREGKLSLETASRLIVQLCRALQVAHAAGVIHRDIKPSNVFLVKSELDDEPFVKLMDFGIAKSTVESDGEETTRAGTVVGTPSYMSPEQILSKRLDARTDLWGVAACLYRVVCGRTPFGQGGFAELGLRVLATEPLPPSTLNPALPRALDGFMKKALAKSAEERFQSARDFADALALIGGQTVEATCITTIVPLAEETSVQGVSDQNTQRERPYRKPKNTAHLAGFAAAVAALAMLGIRHRAPASLTEASGASAVTEASAVTQPAPPVAVAAAPASAVPVPSASVAPTVSVEPSTSPAAVKSATIKASPPKKPRPESSGAWSKRDEL